MGKTNTFSIPEKIVFSLGLLVLMGLLGYLVFQIVQRENSPAAIEVRTSYHPELPHTTFKAVVANEGNETAEAMNLVFALYRAGEFVETTSATVNYVPIHSEATLWIVFHPTQKGDSLAVSSVTYLAP